MSSGYFRNSGCRITNDVQIRGYEAVIMENDLIEVVILPGKGTDIFRLIYKPLGIDMLGKTPMGLREKDFAINTRQLDEGSFSDFYEGGWQEIFPSGVTIDPSIVPAQGFHGEVWGLKWKYEILEDSPEQISIKFFTKTYRTPFYIEKTITIENYKSAVYFKERIINHGSDPQQYMWGQHPVFGEPLLSGDSYIKIRGGVVKALSDSDEKSRFKNNSVFEWPIGKGKDGSEIDVSKILPKHREIDDMLFLSEFRDPFYSIVNQKTKVDFHFEWEKKVYPVIWMWMQYNGCTGFPFYGNAYLVALEPFTGFQNDPSSPVLNPAEEVQTEFFVNISSY